MGLDIIFSNLQLIPKGVIIKDPFLRIPTEFKLNSSILKIIGSKGGTIFFTLMSLKHLAEKGILGKYLFLRLSEILENPDSIYTGHLENRFLISKKIYTNLKLKPHVVTLEITQEFEDIIVTSFIAKDKYFKNLELLWGTTSSPSQQFPKE